MKKWWQQLQQYPLPALVICGAIISLLAGLQYNWAYNNNFFSDLPVRLVAACVIGLVLGALYFRGILTLLQKLSPDSEATLARKAATMHAPLYILWAIALLPDQRGTLLVVAAGVLVVLFWYFFIYPNERSIKANLAQNAPFFLMVIATIAALGARKVFIPQTSMDTVNWVLQWLNYIKVHGFAAYGDRFTNYSPFYSYALGIGSLLPLTDLEIIKYISIAFDLMSAWYISRMVKLRYPQSPMMPALAFTSFLFLPTVLINSSYWGQCDIIYVAFCLAAVYYLMLPDTRKNNLWAVGLYAMALSVKLQAMLIAPLFAIMWLKRDIRLSNFMLIPAVYVILTIPCVIAGRDFMDVLQVYFRIVEDNPVLTANSPNVYQLVNTNFLFNNAGILVGIGMQAILIFSVAWKMKNKPMNIDLLAHLAFFITLLMPFFLPRMHERYFLLAECTALLFAFYNPRYFYMPIALGIISFFTYTEFLFAFVLVPFHWLTLAVLTIILIVGRDLLKKLRTDTV